MQKTLAAAITLLLAACSTTTPNTGLSPKSHPLSLQPFAYAQGSLDKEADSPRTPRTGKILLVLAGDSTVTYNAGYAAGLRSHFDQQLQVINLSRGGRTTATFRSDGRWQQMLDLHPDFVLIQFGHNDSAYITLGEYQTNLTRFVDEARAAGITPILATPIARRYFQADRKIHSDLIAHADAVKKIAADKKVLLVDFHQRAIELYEKLGPEATAQWGLQKPNPDLAKATNPATMPAMVYDKTHFSEEASRTMGRVVADELKRAVPPLAEYID
ncbi:MAG TPA: GDSL-type esterase/lipase family protein [Phycisphaerae bacterium]|nr:GDSL-type esterase/lipase family protein [Phycisphaerae bacterium]